MVEDNRFNATCDKLVDRVPRIEAKKGGDGHGKPVSTPPLLLCPTRLPPIG
jgi:hypothetical protein